MLFTVPSPVGVQTLAAASLEKGLLHVEQEVGECFSGSDVQCIVGVHVTLEDGDGQRVEIRINDRFDAYVNGQLLEDTDFVSALSVPVFHVHGISLTCLSHYNIQP